MIGSVEGVPIKLIGRLPEKVGYERTMWTIKSASYYELCDIGQRLEDARHPTYGILFEEIKLLKARLFLETGRGNNNSDRDYSSLSKPFNPKEEATARHQKGSVAPPVSSKKELEDLIRDASSQIMSATDVLSKVLPWVESREKLMEILCGPDEYSRVKIFQNLMGILWLRFSDFWDIEVSIKLIPHRTNF